jgi:hypothetical protein
MNFRTAFPERIASVIARSQSGLGIACQLAKDFAWPLV